MNQQAPEYLFIANPTSGRRKARWLAEEVMQRVRAAGRSAELALTGAPGQARTLAAEAAKRGTRVVVASGGDGTMQEVASALAGGPCVMGVLPGGRCNDFAHALDIHKRDPLDAHAKMLLEGRARKIDLGLVRSGGEGAGERRRFCTVATLGFDSHVSRFVETHRLPVRGAPAYILGVLRHLFRFRPPLVRLRGDFGEMEERILLVATGNAETYGGAMRIAPGAKLDDGQLDVCVVKAVPRRTILRIFPKVFSGKHVNHPAVKLLRTRRIEIEAPEAPEWICADGESLMQTPVVMEVEPGTLEVLASR